MAWVQILNLGHLALGKSLQPSEPVPLLAEVKWGLHELS